MDKTLKLVGRSSNEIYVLRYPSSLLDFCDYDMSYFAKGAVEACSEAQKTGEVDFDRFSELRREIQTAHCYIEHHIRTIYEKIPIDCYIDYLCRRDNVGTGTLWNRFISCRTTFEKMMFQRLCELRYNRAINEWLNILRVQDYAKSKVDFVFPSGIRSSADAAARRNYFDLMFSVTASEMGCRLDKLGETKVFSIGRIPNSPFMFPAISKDIIRNVLADFDYSDDYSDIVDYSGISDEIAMDAFSRMKNGLSAELSSYNILRSKMENYNKIYMPCSLKAVIDLEIDAVIESGGYLSTCLKCGKRYYRDKDYDEDYCMYLYNGKSCLEAYREENPPKRMTEELEEKSREVTDAVYSRVGSSMNTKEYENWYSYMTAMMDKVRSGEISPEEFDAFLDYSRDFDISRSKPIVEVPKPQSGKERVVKPFVPERIERSAIKAPSLVPEPEEPELPENSAQSQHKDGFFVSPSVARRSSERRISHIIRAGEPRGEENYNTRPNPADFRPFVPQGEQPRPDSQEPSRLSIQRLIEERFGGEELKPADNPRVSGDNVEDKVLAELEALRGRSEQKQTGEFRPFFEKNDFVPVGQDDFDNVEPAAEPGADLDSDADKIPDKPAEQPAPRPRVIKKNAAAISAYGKMSGAPVISAPPEMDLVSRASADESRIPAGSAAEKPGRGIAVPAETLPEPDAEPFKDIGSIFDVLENSSAENPPKHEKRKSSEKTERRRSSKRSFESDEPAPEWSSNEPREYPSSITKENAPSGIWTEDRDALHEENRSELDMLKEKKQHTKSNKTKRLFDVIMREPDDNPNVRKK